MKDFKNISFKDFAAMVSKKLTEHKLDCILVGGGCVSIYSQNRYQSYDLDYVTYEDMKKITQALNELDFQKKGRYFNHPQCPYFIEFVSPPVAIGNEPIHHFESYQTKLGTIKMLTPTDCVKDRLASFYHWDDKQALDQALIVSKEMGKKIDIDAIKSWSKKEGHAKKFDHFYTKLSS